MKIASPSKDAAKKWLLLPVLERMSVKVGEDSQKTTKEEILQTKEEILQTKEEILHVVDTYWKESTGTMRDDEVAMGVLSKYLEGKFTGTNCWDLVVERLIVLCTPPPPRGASAGDDTKMGDGHKKINVDYESSPEGRFLSSGSM